jgi:hypothetical protein
MIEAEPRASGVWPIAQVLDLDARRRREARGAARFVDVAVAVGALGLVSEVLRPALFAGTGDPVGPEAVGAVCTRVALVAFVWGALAAYDALIRAPWRAALHLHPVDPAAVALAGLWHERRAAAAVACGLGALGWPLAASGQFSAFVGLFAVAGGGVVLGLGASAVACLGAVAMAEDPRFAPYLDALRGNNPRAQAALLYAPGAALLGSGWLLVGASAGGAAVAAGDLRGVAPLIAPWIAAGAAMAAVPALARKTWFEASGVLAEIQARYDALERPEEARAVFLDWTVRWLPASVAPHALRDLRSGWRGHRGHLSVAWLFGLGGAWVAWSDDPAVVAEAAGVAALGMWAVAAVALRLFEDEGAFLTWWTPLDGWTPSLGRMYAVFQWVGPCAWAPVLAIAARAGVGAAAGVALALAAVGLSAAGAVTVSGGRSSRPVLTYGAVAAIGAAASYRAMMELS